MAPRTLRWRTGRRPTAPSGRRWCAPVVCWTTPAPGRTSVPRPWRAFRPDTLAGWRGSRKPTPRFSPWLRSSGQHRRGCWPGLTRCRRSLPPAVRPSSTPGPRPQRRGAAARLERAVPPAADSRPASRPLDQHPQARPDQVDRRPARGRLELAGDLADAASTELETAKRRRDGTMIAVLALMPMRRRAFTELELGTSVLVHPDRIEFACPAR